MFLPFAMSFFSTNVSIVIHDVDICSLIAPQFVHRRCARKHIREGRDPHKDSKFVIFSGTLKAMVASIFE